MANLITEDCVSCGACRHVCPSAGISRGVNGSDVFVIDPTRCTECVGFFHTQQCARVCPIDDCCVVDPDNVETEAVLFARAKKRHGNGLELGPETSHFRAANRTLGTSIKHLGRRINDVLQGPDPHT